MSVDLEPIVKLTRDLKKATITLSIPEVRYLVDMYYTIQDFRKQTGGQVMALSRSGEPHSVIIWLHENMETLEGQIKKALDAYTDSTHMGQWAKSICGIGPIIAAGLEAHIDITKAPTVGHIWNFAGLNPEAKWERGQKRPWNARLKTLCWLIGESFVKVSGNEADVYGKIYLQRKAIEQQKNAAGSFQEQAEAGAKRVGKSTEAYKSYIEGKLPDGHIHSRAKRYAVKLFLSHWHAEAYRHHYGTEPPLPYPIAILGHAHVI